MSCAVVTDLVVVQRERWDRRDDGAVVVHEDVVVPDGIDDLPRLGIRWDLPVDLDHVTWYGLGPVESYPDRRRGCAPRAVHPDRSPSSTCPT